MRFTKPNPRVSGGEAHCWAAGSERLVEAAKALANLVDGFGETDGGRPNRRQVTLPGGLEVSKDFVGELRAGGVWGSESRSRGTGSREQSGRERPSGAGRSTRRSGREPRGRPRRPRRGRGPSVAGVAGLPRMRPEAKMPRGSLPTRVGSKRSPRCGRLEVPVLQAFRLSSPRSSCRIAFWKASLGQSKLAGSQVRSQVAVGGKTCGSVERPWQGPAENLLDLLQELRVVALVCRVVAPALGRPLHEGQGGRRQELGRLSDLHSRGERDEHLAGLEHVKAPADLAAERLQRSLARGDLLGGDLGRNSGREVWPVDLAGPVPADLKRDQGERRRRRCLARAVDEPTPRFGLMCSPDVGLEQLGDRAARVRVGDGALEEEWRYSGLPSRLIGPDSRVLWRRKAHRPQTRGWPSTGPSVHLKRTCHRKEASAGRLGRSGGASHRLARSSAPRRAARGSGGHEREHRERDNKHGRVDYSGGVCRSGYRDASDWPRARRLFEAGAG